MRWALRAGRKAAVGTPMRESNPASWSSTMSGRVPTTTSGEAWRWAPPSGGVVPSTGTSEVRQASSPWVKVVSMPLPE